MRCSDRSVLYVLKLVCGFHVVRSAVIAVKDYAAVLERSLIMRPAPQIRDLVAMPGMSWDMRVWGFTELFIRLLQVCARTRVGSCEEGRPALWGLRVPV